QHRAGRRPRNGIHLRRPRHTRGGAPRQPYGTQDGGRQLADDVDPFVEVVPLVSFGEAKELLLLDAQEGDRLDIVNETRCGHVAGKVNTDQENQGTIREPFRLGHIPGREQKPDLRTSLEDRRSGWCASYLSDLVG